MSTTACSEGLQTAQSKHRNILRRSLLILGLSGLVAGLWLGWRTLRNRPDQTFAVAFSGKAGARSITVETFLPSQAKPSRERVPAVVLLHGVEGAMRYAGHHHATARALADEGYAVFFVHYFNAVNYADLWHLKPSGDLDIEVIDRCIARDKGEWISAVSTSLCEIAKRPEVDADRISLLGYSLGSFISYSVGQAALADPAIPDIACVVGNWGAKFSDLKFTPGYPEVLHIHGAADRVVEPRWARQTVEEIQAVGTAAKLIIVPAAGHPAHNAETWQATLGFLRQKFESIAKRRAVLFPVQNYRLAYCPPGFHWPRFP